MTHNDIWRVNDRWLAICFGQQTYLKTFKKLQIPATKSSMCASLCVPAPCRDAATAGITARLNHGTGAPGLRLMWSQRVIETKTNRSKTDRTKSYAPQKTIHSALARNVNDSCGDLRSVCFNGWMDTHAHLERQSCNFGSQKCIPESAPHFSWAACECLKNKC